MNLLGGGDVGTLQHSFSLPTAVFEEDSQAW